MSATKPRAGAVVGALAADLVLVVVFAVIGRASHDEEVWSGLGVTAWPFLVALLAGWLLALAWRAPTAPLRSGVPIWLITVIGGMVLRAVSGQGVAIAFIIVATIVLGVLLVGWRAAARGFHRIRRDS